jgi:hypothetical protein
MIENWKSLVRLGIREANGEAHGAGISKAYQEYSPHLLILVVFRLGVVEVSGAQPPVMSTWPKYLHSPSNP